MPVFKTAYNGYAVKFSPFVETRLAVATAQNFGIIGNGRQHVLELTPNGIVEVCAFDTADGIYDCTWSEDNENLVVSASGDGSVKVWDMALPPVANPIRSLEEHTREVYSVDWNSVRKDCFLTGSWDDTIRLWTVDRPQSLRLFREHTYCIYASVWNPRHADVFASASGEVQRRVVGLSSVSRWRHWTRGRRGSEPGRVQMAPKRGGKAPAPAKKKQVAKVVNPLFEKRPKQFGIGGALPPKKDLHRFVKWPKVVRIQRQRRVLKQRLKVPPALNQFTKTLDKNLASILFKMLLKYRPEDKAAKKERLLKKAQAEAEGKTVEVKKPIVVKYGINHVTYLIEQSKAQLVVIAHDVDPIELVVWLPALCRKMNIPYAIVKGKARLGAIVHKKTATALCLTSVKNEDKLEFSKIVEAVKANFNDKFDEYRRQWGGGIMGTKSQAKTKAKEKILAKEAAQRMT